MSVIVEALSIADSSQRVVDLIVQGVFNQQNHRRLDITSAGNGDVSSMAKIWLGTN